MKNKKIPMRRCVGCMESKPKNQLIRVACYENQVTVDPTGKANGRGFYVCLDKACIELAQKKRAMQRNFDIEISQETVERVFEELLEHEQKNN